MCTYIKKLGGKVSHRRNYLESCTHKVYLQPILSALKHSPTGADGEHENLPMNPQAMTDATNWPTDHHADSNVKVHYRGRMDVTAR